MIKRASWFAALALLLLLTPLLTAHARVAFRWGFNRSTADTLAKLGGSLAYDADIDINGGNGHVYAYGFPGDLSTYLPALYRHFKSESLAPNKNVNATMRMATIERDTSTLRLVLLDLTTEGRALVFAIEQSQNERAASDEMPDRATLKGIGPLPVAEPVFYVRDRRAGMSLVVQKTKLSPLSVHQTFAAQLRASDWLPALPELKHRPANETRFAVYMNGDNTCVSLATLDQSTGTTRITVLHKQPGIE